jgi:hypothetical protein
MARRGGRGHPFVALTAADRRDPGVSGLSGDVGRLLLPCDSVNRRSAFSLLAALLITAGCSDGGAGAVATTSDPPRPTAAPTTARRPDTTEVLLAALPNTAHLPDEWSLSGGDSNTMMSAGGGVLAGACNQGNQDWRAEANNVEAAANGASYGSPQGAIGYVTLYAFPTVADAEGYLALTREQANCTLDFAVPEGPENGEYNGFDDESLIGLLTWDVHEVVTTEERDAEGVDESLVMVVDQVFSATLDGVGYSAAERSVNVVERYGRFVLTANLDSYCCTTGYDGSPGDYSAQLADLEPAVVLFRDHALAVLRESDLL